MYTTCKRVRTRSRREEDHCFIVPDSPTSAVFIKSISFISPEIVNNVLDELNLTKIPISCMLLEVMKVLKVKEQTSFYIRWYAASYFGLHLMMPNYVYHRKREIKSLSHTHLML